MPRLVEIPSFGGPDVLRVRQVESSAAGTGEVRVRVLAAGLNPVDWKIFAGGQAAVSYGVTLPSGNGNDFAGVVEEVGAGVTRFAPGDAVLGGYRFFAQADYFVVSEEKLVLKPADLAFEQAGSLDIAGRTAWASVRSQSLTAEDTVLVSAAAGGVGVLAAQLALRAGATVIGTASEHNHEYLRDLGVIPVSYGDGLADRVRVVAPQGVTAVLDNFGPSTIDAARELGVPAERINTIAAHGYLPELPIAHVGGSFADRDDLAAVAALIASGEIDLPIDSIYPLERVAEAYERLIAGHLRGKIVLVTD
jgi:NADPH:quinone reductase-like Zn-dependent oxidoreductase